MPFARCYFHVVWATKRRAEIIAPALGDLILTTIARKSNALQSPILASFAMPDHVHVAVNLSPRVAISEWARQVKGLSSHEVNAMFPNLETSFSWQKSYGALTFGTTQQAFVCGYIQNQRAHHARELQLYEWLERTTESSEEEADADC